MKKDNLYNSNNPDNQNERLLDILCDVDEKYITEAAPESSNKKILIFNKWFGMVAGIVLVAGCVLTVHTLLPDKAKYPQDKVETEPSNEIYSGSDDADIYPEIGTEANDNEIGKITEDDERITENQAVTGNNNKVTENIPTSGAIATDTVEGQTTTDEEMETTTELGIIPKWDELTITEQFPEFQYNDNLYSARSKALSADKVGTEECVLVMTGYDIYEDKYHEKQATIYQLKDIKIDIAMAVKFDGADEYYIYINSWYRPETLGEFIDELLLEESINFGSVWYSYANENNDYVHVEYTNLKDDIVWEMLLADRTLKNVYDQNEMYLSVISIGVELPLLGEKKSISLTADGYLKTNIFDTGKAFYIGKEKVQAFIDYVVENCEGKSLYDNQTEEPTTVHDIILDENEYTEEMTSSAFNIGTGNDIYEGDTYIEETTTALPEGIAIEETEKISSGYNPNK